MQSKMLPSKERLAVERRAQPQRPALGDGTGAAWTRMRQRLAGAEREARVARRVALALFGVALVTVAGSLTRVLPGVAAVRSIDSAAAPPVRVAATPHGGSPLPNYEPEPAADPQAAAGHPQLALVPPPVKGSGSTYPSLASAGYTPEPGSVERLAGKPGVVPPSGSSQGRPRPEPAVGGRAGRTATESETHGGQRRVAGSHVRKDPAGAAVALATLPHHSVRQPVTGQPTAVRRSGRRTASASVRRRARVRARGRRLRRTVGRPTYWRAHRVTREGSSRYCLVDPQGNWWIARRVRPRAGR
jgi:hypothetical protein